jgi:ubiquinone/menaquinone biosynthesis C-methylase UbiE
MQCIMQSLLNNCVKLLGFSRKIVRSKRIFPILFAGCVRLIGQNPMNDNLQTLSSSDFSANVERFSGYADLYQKFRPQPPSVIVQVLKQLAQMARPRLVVDMGCGTGLSTRTWAEHADKVIGIEPSQDMRSQAAALTKQENVSYQAGFSHQTGLDNNCADIVTCSQSLHWMEPQPTFAEVARILRPGGVFAAYDNDEPPTTAAWEAEAAYVEFLERVWQLEDKHKTREGLKRWPKAQHLDRMKSSGLFRYTKEFTLHHIEMGNADRLVGLALSQGSVAGLLKRGIEKSVLGLEKLKAIAESSLGSNPQPWYWSYRLRIGIV